VLLVIVGVGVVVALISAIDVVVDQNFESYDVTLLIKEMKKALSHCHHPQNCNHSRHTCCYRCCCSFLNDVVVAVVIFVVIVFVVVAVAVVIVVAVVGGAGGGGAGINPSSVISGTFCSR
jgi:small-conductance mechanosensitive channel